MIYYYKVANSKTNEYITSTGENFNNFVAITEFHRNRPTITALSTLIIFFTEIENLRNK